MNQHEFYERERASLREELHNLKGCQITFLTSSVTATGVILGIAASLISTPFHSFSFSPKIVSLIPLTPLIVLLPSWWVFFDKATTITRIIGYYRILEKLILQRCEAINFLGWENALGEFRKRQANGQLILPNEYKDNLRFSTFIKMFFLRTTHPYSVISYDTFFALSILCIVASITSIVSFKIKTLLIFVIIILFVGLFLISAFWNVRALWRIIYGRHSYDCNECFWNQVLETKVSHTSSSI